MGWASQLLDSWKEPLRLKKEAQIPPKVSFYGVRKVLCPVEDATTVPSNKVMFRRLTKSRNDQQGPIYDKSAPCVSKRLLKPNFFDEKKRRTSADLADYQDSKRLKKDGNSPNCYEQNLLDMYK